MHTVFVSNVLCTCFCNKFLSFFLFVVLNFLGREGNDALFASQELKTHALIGFILVLYYRFGLD